MEEFERRMKDRLGERFLRSYPMSEYTSFRIGGPADFIAFPENKDELKFVLEEVKTLNIPYLVLGCGTNVLVRDGGVEGMVISTRKGLNRMEVLFDSGKVVADVECGVPLSTLVAEVSNAGGRGIECVAGIPGNLGGAIKTNAGTREGDISKFVREIRVYDENLREKVIPRDKLNFSYRKLSIPKKWVILGAVLEFEREFPEITKERVKGVLDFRMKTQPYGVPSAGCIFKNPGGISAGRLIEEAGLKGVRVRGARISEVHGNFIVNERNARARDVLALIEVVKEKIREEKGISLELEIEVIGRE